MIDGILINISVEIPPWISPRVPPVISLGISRNPLRILLGFFHEHPGQVRRG